MKPCRTALVSWLSLAVLSLVFVVLGYQIHFAVLASYALSGAVLTLLAGKMGSKTLGAVATVPMIIYSPLLALYLVKKIYEEGCEP